MRGRARPPLRPTAGPSMGKSARAGSWSSRRCNHSAAFSCIQARSARCRCSRECEGCGDWQRRGLLLSCLCALRTRSWRGRATLTSELSYRRRDDPKCSQQCTYNTNQRSSIAEGCFYFPKLVYNKNSGFNIETFFFPPPEEKSNFCNTSFPKDVQLVPFKAYFH